VKNSEDIYGWVLIWLIRSDSDLQTVPVIEPDNAQLIEGRVLDVNGTPIQGVTFGVVQGSGPNAPTNAVKTDANGEFYSYLPLSAAGVWKVSYVGIACVSNVWTDSSCADYKPGYTGNVDPVTTDVTLPFNGMLTFIWR
jgi:hypothetical protein